jgi:chromate transporter
MFGPSSLVVYLAARVWHGAAQSAWRQIAERALAPIGVGLTLASGLALVHGTEHSLPAYAVTAVTTLLLAFTELHPLPIMVAGAVLMVLAGG